MAKRRAGAAGTCLLPRRSGGSRAEIATCALPPPRRAIVQDDRQPRPPLSGSGSRRQIFRPDPRKFFRNQRDHNGHGTLEASRGEGGLFSEAQGERLRPGRYRFHLPVGQPLASDCRSIADWVPFLGLMRCGRSWPGWDGPKYLWDRERVLPAPRGAAAALGFPISDRARYPAGLSNFRPND